MPKHCWSHAAGLVDPADLQECPSWVETEKFRRVSGYQGCTLRAPASTLGPFPRSGPGDNVARSRLRANLACRGEEPDGYNGAH
jgi:hypothetical protein